MKNKNPTDVNYTTSNSNGKSLHNKCDIKNLEMKANIHFSFADP